MYTLLKFTYIHPKTYPRLFRAALFLIVPTWEYPKFPSTIEWVNKLWYTYNGILHSSENKQITATCNDREESQKHNVEQKKSDIKKFAV